MKSEPVSLRTVTVMRYILPLREGGSLPALAEADDNFKYVLKFRGAGHGVKMLISELLGGEIARALGLRVPELVFAELDACFGRTEADEEIQDLLKFSAGLNLALHYLSGAINFDPTANDIDPYLASKIVWLDAYITNIDRTFRNTNMLMWKKELWLIDHGASFYFHYNFESWEKNALGKFPYIKDHVLLPRAEHLEQVDNEFKKILTPEIISGIVSLIPDTWLEWADTDFSPDKLRGIYQEFLIRRLGHSENFVNEAQYAREHLI